MVTRGRSRFPLLMSAINAARSGVFQGFSCPFVGSCLGRPECGKSGELFIGDAAKGSGSGGGRGDSVGGIITYLTNRTLRLCSDYATNVPFQKVIRKIQLTWLFFGWRWFIGPPPNLSVSLSVVEFTQAKLSSSMRQNYALPIRTSWISPTKTGNAVFQLVGCPNYDRQPRWDETANCHVVYTGR